MRQGFGAGLVFPTLATAAISRVEKQDISVFSGFISVLDILSLCTGQAVSISVVESFGGTHSADAYAAAFKIMLPLVLGPFLLSFWLSFLIRFRIPVSEGGGQKPVQLRDDSQLVKGEHVSIPLSDSVPDSAEIEPSEKIDCDSETHDLDDALPNGEELDVANGESAPFVVEATKS